ncbi:MAG: fatty acid desaturase family protein [Oceanococcus sp.]
MTTVKQLKAHKRAIVDHYAQPSDASGLIQVLNTLIPLVGLWLFVVWAWPNSMLVVVVATLAMSIMLLRVFVLMHECGHGSLFKTPAFNKAAGFMFGVISGMPQFVWAQHHNFHHATNGNWAKYRGPLATKSVEEYAALSEQQQRAYVRQRKIVMAPLGGLLYTIINPRLNWLKGSVGLVAHCVRGLRAQPGVKLSTHLASYQSRYWSSALEYRHMSANNVVLLTLWALMSWLIGPLLFFTVYFISGALAGGAGIILFTVQHNFEHAYAVDENDWCYDTAALHGTSYLVLPKWMNWVTASIGYHHIHHLSARIPNYRLAACHAENAHLFGDVKQLSFREVFTSLHYLLWCTESKRIISIAEYEASKKAR